MDTIPRDRLLGLLTITALAALGCAHGGIGKAEGWSVVKSPHFSLYVLYPRETQLLVRDLELAHSSIGSTFFKNVELPRTDVLVLTPETFEEVFGAYRNTVALARSPGGAAIGKDGLLITKDDKAHPVVSEALAHLYIHKGSKGAPLWFHEGFSGYLRTAEYRYGQGDQMACFGVLPREKEPLIPVRKLVELSWDDYDGDEARTWYRYTSRLLIDFIMHGAAGKNSIRMRPLVEAVGQGQPGIATVEAAFPNVAFETLDKKLSEHAADVVYQVGSAAPLRGLCPLPARIPPERAVDERKPEVSAAPADALAALFQALLKLPRRTGYPPWYPPEVVERAR
jgi:hypothetical protein